MRGAPRVLWRLFVPVIKLHGPLALLMGAGCFSDGGVGLTRGESTSGGSTSGELTSESSGEAPTTCADECAPEPVCGDGVAMAPEECDDGDDDDTDVCTSACKLPACGDGFVQGGEGCDDGPGNADDGACTLACAPAVCGDGKVQAGVEACDDGNLADGDGCSGACALEVCGNGILEGSEECDDGDASEVDDCKLDCTPAVCGDGVAAVLATVPEACDDGNANEMDMCTSMCTTTVMGTCGNMVVEGGEECDDGNMEDNDTCATTCKRVAFYVFVTQGTSTGILGGLAGADMKCAMAAASASLPGKYKAWLSAGNTSAADRLHKSTLPYIRTDTVVVATDWDSLVTKNLLAPINRTETKSMVLARLYCVEQL
jgi:cysteine-rich repeat protein